MRHLAVLMGVVSAVCGAPAVHAQQPPGKPPEGKMMLTMDSLDRRLDSLVDRMNRASGNQKVAAMAAVLNELVAQRKGMHRHMRMMEGKSGMEDMSSDSAPPARVPQPAGADSTPSDSANHAAHHPSG